MKSYASLFPASSRKLQFNLLLAHRGDPFSLCSFGVLRNEKCYVVIKHSLNETCSELSLKLMNLLLSPRIHLPMAQSLTQLSDSLALRETQNRNCSIISDQKSGVLAERCGEDHSLPKWDIELHLLGLETLNCV